jgi:beta-galactosidase
MSDASEIPDAVRPHDPSGLNASVGRLPIHAVRRAPHIPLDGTWQFQLLDGDASRTQDAWEDATVPELWTMRSAHDPPRYTNVAMPFDQIPPTLPPDNPVGVYRRDVELTPSPGRRIILHIGAAEGYLRVAVNGIGVGTSTDSHLEAEFDITDLVVQGHNGIELRIAKWSGQAYLEDQDQWWQSGITRSVFIYEVPEERIADVVAVADFDAVSGTGSLSLDVHTEGIAHGWDADGWAVEIAALGEARVSTVPVRQAAQTIPRQQNARATRPDPRLPEDFMDLLSIRAAGAPVPDKFAAIAARFAQTVSHTTASGVAHHERQNLQVSPWTAETPHLESVAVRLLDPEGNVVDDVSLTVGFRRVEIVGRDLLVNGQRVLIQGVNRHDIDPQTGRVMTRQRLHDELSLLKKFNVNAIRSAHYPNDPYLLDLCDEFGFYVIDEADIEGHAFAGTLADDPRYLTAFHDRYSRMVIRDRNHPSVIAWSLGNETGYGAAHDALAAWSRRFDPTRPVHYEGAIATDWHAGHAATDLVCPMYPAFEALEAYSADPTANRPVILCEYAYSQGNSTGGFAHYWKLFESLPGLQGGFVWEFLDHALDPDRDGRGRYGGDFGDTPNDGYIMLNGVAFSDLTPKPAFYEMRSVFAPFRIVSGAADALAGVLRLHNRQSFAGLDDLRFDVHVDTLDGPAGQVTLPGVTAAPGRETTVAIPDAVVELLRSAGSLAMSVTARTSRETGWAPAGTELVTQQVILQRSVAALPTVGSAAALDESGDVTHPLLQTAPRLSLWRALTDNDASYALDNRFVRSGFFLLRAADLTVEHAADSSTVVITYQAAFGDEVVHRRRITQLGEGDWVFDEHVTLPEGTRDGLRVGVEFVLRDGFESASWVGLGPWENFPDRRSGALLGRWQSSITDLAVPYVYPQHHGTRGGVTSVKLTGPAGGALLSTERELHATITRHSAAELEAASHWWKLPQSDVTIVNLDVAHRGVGMARLGPDTRPEHRLREGEYSWRWRLTVDTGPVAPLATDISTETERFE